MGWIDWDAGEVLIDATGAYADILRHAKDISLTKITLLKRLRDAGLLMRVDDLRKRNTIRMTCQGSIRQVLVMPIAQTLETSEVPNGQKDFITNS